MVRGFSIVSMTKGNDEKLKFVVMGFNIFIFFAYVWFYLVRCELIA
jgi:hypothetical protein